VLCRFSAAVSGSQVPGAAEIGWYDNTVRRWLHRFNAAGIDGLGNRPGAERRRPITEAQRSAIVAMARSVPTGPGRWPVSHVHRIHRRGDISSFVTDFLVTPAGLQAIT
jgi:hypothetical protein